MPPKRLSDDDVQNALTREVRRAVNFVESEIAPDRLKAARYFKGETDLGVEDGRSRVVATKVRDHVRAIKPVLLRVFLQSDRPVEFVPRQPAHVQAAEQATAYARAIFDRNDGFRLVSAAFHDALVSKTGILKVTFDESPEITVDNYSGLPPEALQIISSEPDVELLGEPEVAEDGSLSLTVAKTTTKGRITLAAVPPETFFVDRGATGIEDARVCGHSAESTVGDVVAMGFDFEEVLALAGDEGSTMAEAAEEERKGWTDEDDDGTVDPTARPILLTEAYMKMDIEGTGIPRDYKFICAGDDYTILDREPCDMNPFAVFEVDPEPHAFFGRSLVDLIIEDQDAATSLLRGLLDAIAMANNPRMEVAEGQANLDDVLNNEYGAVIRSKAIGSVVPLVFGANIAQVLPALQHYDATIEAKTGVGGAAMGMDADALQSQTAAGVNAAVQASTAQAEMAARNLAEGMKMLFRKIAQLARQHPDPEAMVRVNGQFVQVDPRSWASDMDVAINVGLGTGKHEERMMTLQFILQQQSAIFMQGGGPQNGLVGLTHIRNTLADIAAHGGLTNADRYFSPMNPQAEQQLLQQAAQAQGQAPTDPLVQAETIKAQAKQQTDASRLQLDAQRAQADFAVEAMKLQAADDLARDKMTQDMALKAAEIQGRHALAVDQNRVRAEQAMARPAPGQRPAT